MNGKIERRWQNLERSVRLAKQPYNSLQRLLERSGRWMSQLLPIFSLRFWACVCSLLDFFKRKGCSQQLFCLLVSLFQYILLHSCRAYPVLQMERAFECSQLLLVLVEAISKLCINQRICSAYPLLPRWFHWWIFCLIDIYHSLSGITGQCWWSGFASSRIEN